MSLLEDISSIGDKEEEALIEGNIVARLIPLLSTAINHMLESQQPDRTLYDLYAKTMTILGNLCHSERIDARVDVLKHMTIDLIAKVISLSSNCINVYGLEFLDLTLWFLERLSHNFETRHISEESEEPLIQGLLQCLFFSDR